MSKDLSFVRAEKVEPAERRDRLQRGPEHRARQEGGLQGGGWQGVRCARGHGPVGDASGTSSPWHLSCQGPQATHRSVPARPPLALDSLLPMDATMVPLPASPDMACAASMAHLRGLARPRHHRRALRRLSQGPRLRPRRGIIAELHGGYPVFGFPMYVSKDLDELTCPRTPASSPSSAP